MQCALLLTCPSPRFSSASSLAADTVKNLNDHVSGIRGALGNKVRYQLRVIPELRFDIDDSLDYLERIDELLKK